MSNLNAQLEFMAEGGQSVTLGYGEDDGQWECSWISGGKRFTQHSSSAEVAVKCCLRQVKDAMEEIPEAARNTEFYDKICWLLKDEE